MTSNVKSYLLYVVAILLLVGGIAYFAIYSQKEEDEWLVPIAPIWIVFLSVLFALIAAGGGMSIYVKSKKS